MSVSPLSSFVDVCLFCKCVLTARQPLGAEPYYIMAQIYLYAFPRVCYINVLYTFRGLVNDRCTILFYVFTYIFNSLHVSSTSCSSLGETNCVNTTSGSCHCVSVAVSFTGRKFISDLHTTRPPARTDSYQRLY